jgi:hypothetical protein
MGDEYELEEVSGAVSLGLLASDVAIACSRLLRRVDLSESEQQALQAGHLLLQALSEPLGDIRPSDRLGQLGSKSSAIDALHAVELRVPGKDIREFVEPLAQSVAKVLAGAPIDEHADHIEAVRDLFATLSEVEVSRLSNLSRPRPDIPRWQTSTANSLS